MKHLQKDYADAVAAKADNVVGDEPASYNLLISLAAERGYEITEEELKEIYASQSEFLSDEELGKVSGGSSILCVGSILVTVSTIFATVEKTVDITYDLTK